MNLNKIDSRLIETISILNCETKTECFVFAKDFDATRRLLKNKKVSVLCEYLFINCFCCFLSQKQIFDLSDYGMVKHISSDPKAFSLMYIAKSVLQKEKCKLNGDGVGIAFIDTGACPHADFVLGENRIKTFKDFVGGRKNPYDDNGHGTFVCGVCSGNGVMSKFRYSGIACKSQMHILKALDANGEANASRILDAMQWVYENHKKCNIKIVCMSFGSEPLGFNDPIVMGAEALWEDGVLVVAAAGNSGPEFQTIKSPGISRKIVTVGGIDDNRYDNKSYNKNFFEIADFSSRGPAFRSAKPDVVAPSVEITSCSAKGLYSQLSGTSVATPMVAGVCALILQKYPTFSPDKVKRVLSQICNPLGFGQNLEGYGLPDLSKLYI